MQKYDAVRTCGEGTFAVVFEAVRRADGVRVAVKKIKTPQPSWQACLSLRELRSFKTIGSHPHIVKLHELVLERKLLHFVFEFCESNLHQYLSSSSAALPSPQAAELLAQLLSGVGHLHAHGFMHRDLKPENVLIDAGHPQREHRSWWKAPSALSSGQHPCARPVLQGLRLLQLVPERSLSILDADPAAGARLRPPQS